MANRSTRTRIGLVVEGPSERLFWLELKRRGHIQNIYVYNAGNKDRMWSRRHNFISLASIDKCKIIIFLPDLLESGHSYACTLNREYINSVNIDNVKCIVQQMEFEAWLLADQEAIRNTYGVMYTCRRMTDNIPKPTRRIKDIIKKARKKPGYQKTSDSVKIARKYSIDRAVEKSNSMRRLYRFIENNIT